MRHEASHRARGIVRFTAVVCLLACGRGAIGATPAASASRKPAKPAVPLLDKRSIDIKTKKIKLSEEVVTCIDQPSIIAEDPKGGFWLSWQGKQLVAHIWHLDAGLKPEKSRSIAITNAGVVGIFAHQDGSLAAAVGFYSNSVRKTSLVLRKYSAAGKVQFNTPIVDNNDPQWKNGMETKWSLFDSTGPLCPVVFDGRNYGLYYIVVKHFPDGGVHQGDEFVMVDAKGKVNEATRKTWLASHSFDPHAVMGPDGKMYGITHPDEFPFSGLLMSKFNGKSNPAAFPIWPRMQHPDLVPPRTGKTFVLGNKFAMAINTGIPAQLEDLKSFDLGKNAAELGQGSYTVFLRWDAKGGKAEATYLREKRPPEGNSWCTAERFGKNHVALFDVSANPDTLTTLFYGNLGFDLYILTDKGEPVLESPIRTDEPIVMRSEPISLRNGDVMYASTGFIGSLQDSWNMYLVRICCPPALRAKGPAQAPQATNAVPGDAASPDAATGEAEEVGE